MRLLKVNNLLGLLLILFTIISFTPIIKSGTLITFMSLLFLVMSFIWTNAKHDIVIPVMLYILLCILYRILGISSAPIGALAIHLSFFVLIILLSLCTKSIIGQKDFVIMVVIFVIAFNVIDNIRLCILHPAVYRLVTRSIDTVGGLYNFGSSRFYNSIFFFFTICFFGYLNCKEKRWKKILFCSAAVAFIFIVAFCVKASVIAFTLVSAFLLFFAKRSKSIRSFSFRVLIPSLFLLAIVNIFSDALIELLIKYIPSERLVSRLVVFVDSDSEVASKGVSTMAARGNLWLLSLQTWTDNVVNFMFGIGDHRANYEAGVSALSTGIGQHSDLIDSFARYGLLGVFLLGSIFMKGYKLIKSFYGKYYRVQLFVIYTLFIFFGCTKGLFQPDIAIIMFILLPMLSTVLNNETDNK